MEELKIAIMEVSADKLAKAMREKANQAIYRETEALIHNVLEIIEERANKGFMTDNIRINADRREQSMINAQEILRTMGYSVEGPTKWEYRSNHFWKISW